MRAGVVTQHVVNLIARQVDEHGIVVWYDPEGVYGDLAKSLQLPKTEVLCYEGSFFQLRREIDQKQLMDGEEPPRLVVYVPRAQEKTHHALIELEAAGVVMQPGQQPLARNTRLVVVARAALRGLLPNDTVAQIEKQVEAGKLSLANLDALAAEGGKLSKGVLALIYGTGSPQEIALAFLAGEDSDRELKKKDAIEELKQLLAGEFDFQADRDRDLKDIRQDFSRHILMTDLLAGLGEAIPPRLASVRVATKPAAREACVALAKAWRIRRDTRESYVAAARKVEEQFSLAATDFEPDTIKNLETFPILERALLEHAEKHLLEATDAGILKLMELMELRTKSFWCEVEPQFQARWALVAAVTRVLLEAERVAQALKKAPKTLEGLIGEYAGVPQPWCLLDTHYRTMESHWHNFEPHGGDDQNLEKLIVRARQRYTTVGTELAQKFLSHLEKGLPQKGILHQRAIFEKYVKPALNEGKVAYVWVDALRFEMGRELGRTLGGEFDVDLQPAFAAVPTITEIGMAALLPKAHESAQVVKTKSGRLALQVAEQVLENRKDRIGFLQQNAGVDVVAVKLDDLLPKPSKRVRESLAGARLIIVTSQEIDELCEQDNLAQARRQINGVLNDVRRGIRLLAELGVQRIIVTSDHGHLFAEELNEDMKVEAPGGDTALLRRRVWVGRGGQSLEATFRAPLKKLGMDGDLDVVTPRGFAGFKCPGGARAYFHGGLSPQEVIIPVLVLKPLARSASKGSGFITWQLLPGSQKLTTRCFSVQVMGTIEGLFDVELPKVRVELRARGKTISQVVSASYGLEESTGDVALKKDDADPRRITPNTVTLMVVEEVDQKNVALFLFDAVSGAELAKLEKIEVAISI